ncbi:tRNA (adenosine(37)-N6)-threonylcarbamoyltransferase complex ATPase subunit type 1 TsaE [Aminivibrio sp.]|jgi:tRNA threonylcarbamoyladenosine biosynthesis protein TsaE|uniref:tRNA (adenosine(37)-N6)-threonylcarbamoyltransferase complex ATPase subunit type 1 TsaE n=1 Tax=Aminivibrio sp. TaxID=1872489 RepID=UPI001A4463CA|nr:tRNA (adenosine(37)-N6)-threonylcarbamoyltransferase complex ATPase subunit type 1 TsaE [Aminivibrio sp.]MBL3538880.1 tRNA (adenosine(37)-N6)-threonylcarbamoyltransferase complex ATPase subunit type 1 TsaE [Aminivibrio sp.]
MYFLPSRAAVTESEEETERLGALLAGYFSGGVTILLSGDLGAGKTTLVRGFCEALGYRKVRSPSFTLVNHYIAGKRKIVHSDLYRLDSGDVSDLDLQEYDSGDTVLFVEWAEKAPFFSERPLWKMHISSPDVLSFPERRHFDFFALNPEGEELLSRFWQTIGEEVIPE